MDGDEAKRYIDKMFSELQGHLEFSNQARVDYLPDVNQVVARTEAGQEITRIRLDDINDEHSIWAIGELLGFGILLRMKDALPTFAGSLKRIHSDEYGVSTDLVRRALRLLPMYADDDERSGKRFDELVGKFLAQALTPEQKQACIEAWK